MNFDNVVQCEDGESINTFSFNEESCHDSTRGYDMDTHFLFLPSLLT
jgi:hypothetical protein